MGIRAEGPAVEGVEGGGVGVEAVDVLSKIEGAVHILPGRLIVRVGSLDMRYGVATCYGQPCGCHNKFRLLLCLRRRVDGIRMQLRMKSDFQLGSTTSLS